MLTGLSAARQCFPRKFPNGRDTGPLRAGRRDGEPAEVRASGAAPTKEVHMTTALVNRLLPLAGIVAGIALIAGLLLTGSEPAEDASAAKIVSSYADHDTAVV